MSNTVFSKNMRKLREDKKISQKSAAASLNISQALLSHYEKGIRECGLDFLRRAAKFYNVSTDFMLGITKSPGENNTGVNVNLKKKINDDLLRKNGKEYNISAALYKNLLNNAINYIFDEMKGKEYKEISIICGKYISLAIYCLFSILRGVSNEKVNLDLFKNYDFDNLYLNRIINGVD